MNNNLVGQHRILSQLEDIAWAVKLREVNSVNILLRSPPGFGKTNIAKYIAKQIDNVYVYQQVKVGGTTIFGSNTLRAKVQIVDEIHLDTMLENLYSKMDSNFYIFIFCTTDSGVLQDAFLSRCMSFSLDDYTIDDLAKICYAHGVEIGLNLSRDSSEYIASISRGTPRLCKSLVDRIKIAIVGGRFRNDLDGIISAAEYIGVNQGGFTNDDLRYIELLKQSGYMGLNNLSRILRIDSDTITRVIEPFLIQKGLITITSRGRMYVSS